MTTLDILKAAKASAPSLAAADTTQKNAALTAMADRVIRVRNGTVQSVTINENPQDISEIEW